MVTPPWQVNFLIAGAQKGGTTALASFLAEHREVCMAPAKEVHLFDDPDLADADFGGEMVAARYRAAFPNHAGERWVGEATPSYLYLPGVAERIRRYHSGMRLIVLLREPSARAVSQYQHERRHRHEWLPFVLALAAERRRLCGLARDGRVPWNSSLRRHSYVDRGRYGPQVRRLFAQFPRAQVLCLESRDLAARHDETLRRVYSFLELEPPAVLPAPRRVHGAPPGQRCFAPRLARRHVARECLESTLELERLLGWELDAWKEVARA